MRIDFESIRANRTYVIWPIGSPNYQTLEKITVILSEAKIGPPAQQILRCAQDDMLSGVDQF